MKMLSVPKVHAVYTSKVRYKILSAMIRDNHFHWINPGIRKYFSIDRRATRTKTFILVALKRRMTIDEAIKKIRRKGFNPADIADLLAFGTKYPKQGKKFPIAALGSRLSYTPVYTEVPFIGGNKARRTLCMGSCDIGCPKEWHVLGISD